MDDFFTIVLGALSGGVAAVVLTERRLRAWRRDDQASEPELPSVFPEAEARQAARQWAAARGMPLEAENIVLGKLRLGWQLQQQRERRRRRQRR
jgi:hypothetical protein